MLEKERYFCSNTNCATGLADKSAESLSKAIARLVNRALLCRRSNGALRSRGRIAPLRGRTRAHRTHACVHVCTHLYTCLHELRAICSACVHAHSRSDLARILRIIRACVYEVCYARTIARSAGDSIVSRTRESYGSSPRRGCKLNICRLVWANERARAVKFQFLSPAPSAKRDY